jgi:hypothetical protein
VVGSFRLDEHELRMLEAACRESDVAAEADRAVEQQGAWLRDGRGNLKAHPALAAGRASRLASARLLRAITLPRES